MGEVPGVVYAVSTLVGLDFEEGTALQEERLRAVYLEV